MTTAASERAEVLVERFVETFNSGDRAAFADTLADGFVFHAAGSEHDAATFVDVEFSYHDAFPDLHYTVDDVLPDESVVGFRWTLTGTHDGAGGPGLLADAEPTGREVSVTGLNVARIDDNGFVELWGEWDALGFYAQLGIVDRVE